MRILLAVTLAALFALHGAAQDPPDPDLQQQYELSRAVSEATGSAVDVIRNLEAFLKKYPESKQRQLVEQTVLKAAMDSNDGARIILYGEKLLRNGAKDDTTVLDRVTRALVDSPDPEVAKRALDYAKRYENDVRAKRDETPPGHLTPGQWSDELDLAEARALALEARASGNTGGGAEAAVKLAQKSWEAFPTGEGARELAHWLVQLDRTREAIEYYADAFTLEDARTTTDDRAKDRRRLGDLYANLNGSEKGLGEVVLQAYDRTYGLLDERQARLKARDPNAVAANLEDFVLPSVVKGDSPLPLSTLKGKILVMDFWATWCIPCRAEQPLLENVKKHFEDAKDVVFVAVDADDDPSLAAPFVKEQGWKDPGYFEAGLAQRMTISAIPTLLVIDRSGRVYSKMMGLLPDRFEQMLTQRIEDARQNR